MNKSALAITTVVLALQTIFASSADAHGFGMHHCGGFGVPIFNSYSSDSGSYRHRTYNYSHEARRPVRETVHVQEIERDERCQSRHRRSGGVREFFDCGVQRRRRRGEDHRGPYQDRHGGTSQSRL